MLTDLADDEAGGGYGVILPLLLGRIEDLRAQSQEVGRYQSNNGKEPESQIKCSLKPVGQNWL